MGGVKTSPPPACPALTGVSHGQPAKAWPDFVNRRYFRKLPQGSPGFGLKQACLRMGAACLPA